MSDGAPTATFDAPPAPGAWPMYRALVGVGLLCGLLIVGVFDFTKPIIAKNRAEALQAAILRVVPGAKRAATFAYKDGAFTALGAGEQATDVAYAAYDDGGKLVGVAYTGAQMGYQDVVTVLFGYAPADKVVVGMEILDSRETPGLGDKAEKDPTYLANFKALDVALDDTGKALKNPVQAVKPGEKQHPWQIDTISGATITSRAVANIAGAAAGKWVPRIEAGLAKLSAPPAPPANPAKGGE